MGVRVGLVEVFYLQDKLLRISPKQGDQKGQLPLWAAAERSPYESVYSPPHHAGSSRKQGPHTWIIGT